MLEQWSQCPLVTFSSSTEMKCSFLFKTKKNNVVLSNIYIVFFLYMVMEYIFETGKCQNQKLLKSESAFSGSVTSWTIDWSLKRPPWQDSDPQMWSRSGFLLPQRVFILLNNHEQSGWSNPILDTRISFVLCPSVKFVLPTLKSETGWTGEHWLNHVLLILEN